MGTSLREAINAAKQDASTLGITIYNTQFGFSVSPNGEYNKLTKEDASRLSRMSAKAKANVSHETEDQTPEKPVSRTKKGAKNAGKQPKIAKKAGKIAPKGSKIARQTKGGGPKGRPRKAPYQPVESLEAEGVAEDTPAPKKRTPKALSQPNCRIEAFDVLPRHYNWLMKVARGRMDLAQQVIRRCIAEAARNDPTKGEVVGENSFSGRADGLGRFSGREENE